MLPNGQDDIENLRLVRDPNTLIGKGIGYLLLKNHDAILKVLSLEQEKFKNRMIRISTCGKRTKRSEKRKHVIYINIYIYTIYILVYINDPYFFIQNYNHKF